MKQLLKHSLPYLTVLFLTGALWVAPPSAGAHCDSLDGPVILEAKAALDKGDATGILKWVRAEDEREITEAFQRTLAVRTQGAAAQELADHYFFETLVRVHRAGEGAPYTGLKATVAEAGPAVLAADQALETGSVDALAERIAAAVAKGIRARFAEAHERRQVADRSVAEGREFVAAYVDYVHYVEGIHAAVAKAAGHHDAGHAEPAGKPHGAAAH